MKLFPLYLTCRRCGNTYIEDDWGEARICPNPACRVSGNYTSSRKPPLSGKIVVQTDADLAKASQPSKFAPDVKWECNHCHIAYTQDKWLQNHMLCPSVVCGYRGDFTPVIPATRLSEEVKANASQGPSRYQPIMSQQTVEAQELPDDTTEEVENRKSTQLKPSSSRGKQYAARRVLIAFVCVLLGIGLYNLVNRVGNPSTNQEPIVVTEATATATAPEIASETVADTAPEFEQVVTVREVFVAIRPVLTPWNVIKTFQLICFIFVMLFGLLDRIMSNQWYDAAVAVGAALFCQFGSSTFFNPFAELMTKIPFLGISIKASHWIFAAFVLLACLVSVFWVSVTGTRDWTPFAIFFGLVSSGSIYFGHLGVIQTIFLIPSGAFLSVTESWKARGDVGISLISYMCLALAIYFALVETLKPYMDESISIGSIVVLCISIVGYFILRILCKKVPLLNDPIGDLIAVFIFNFIVAFFLRERMDKKFGNTTAEYKMQLGKVASQFDLIVSFGLLGVLVSQCVGMI